MSSSSKWLNRFVLLLAYFVAQSFCGLALAETTLARGVYNGNISGWKADMVRTLKQTSADRYQLIAEAKNLFASVREFSEFDFKDEQLRPLSYVYERRLFGRNTVEKITFDWDAGTAHYSRSDRPQNDTTHKLENGLLDPALYQLVMQADLAQNRERQSYKFIKRKRIETYTFATLPEETLKIGKNSFQAKLVERKDEQDGRATRIWVLPEVSFQIGQIRHTDDGDTYEIRLAGYEGDAKGLQELYARINKARELNK